MLVFFVLSFMTFVSPYTLGGSLSPSSRLCDVLTDGDLVNILYKSRQPSHLGNKTGVETYYDAGVVEETTSKLVWKGSAGDLSSAVAGNKLLLQCK